SDIPVQVPNLNNVIQIAAGGYHSLFLKSDGSVWSAGFNTSGQLGDGTSIDSPTPQAVTGLSNIVQICAGESHSLALKSDGTVWAWGINTEGEIGDGTTNQSSVPVQVQGLTLQTMISVGSQHNLSVQATQIQAKLSAANPVTRYGQPIKLSVRMKDGNSGLPLIQELVTITLDGAVIGTVTTDSAGKASLIISNPDDYDVGNHAIGATFAGGRLFLAATAAGTLTVNPDNTALASGNLSAYLGATA
ncbi:MAG: Ig-like domain repeat protein, partial [Armatimonadetes bacterium]|nr:Ig-like domain repeat protein [Armatimonadota bacterium]